jgi:hypothetical protein
MYIGGTQAELLEARDGIIRFQAQVPMTPFEKDALDGNVERLNERMKELGDTPPPDPPGPEFIFNPDYHPETSPKWIATETLDRRARS